MNEQDLMKKIKTEVEAETPDILDALLAECGFPEEKKMQETASEAKRKKPFKWRHLYTALVTAAVVLLLVSAVYSLAGRKLITRPEQAQPEVSNSLETPTAAVQDTPETGTSLEKTAMGKQMAIVGLDVNPSVEMVIDEEERVIECKAINEDAKKILRKMDLTGTDVTVASYALIGAMLTDGYLTDETNSILISVSAQESQKGKQLEKRLSDNLNSFLEDSKIGAAIIGQYVEADAEVEAFAKKNGISRGKAWIIQTLLEVRDNLEEKDLLKLSTQELLLLWTETDFPVRKESSPEEQTSTVYGKVSASNYISAEDAENIAFSRVGAPNIQLLSTEFDCYSGMIVYEVEFIADGVEYEIKVHATTGEILEVETEWTESSYVEDDDWDDDREDLEDDDAWDDWDDDDDDDRDSDDDDDDNYDDDDEDDD